MFASVTCHAVGFGPQRRRKGGAGGGGLEGKREGRSGRHMWQWRTHVPRPGEEREERGEGRNGPGEGRSWAGSEGGGEGGDGRRRRWVRDRAGRAAALALKALKASRLHPPREPALSAPRLASVWSQLQTRRPQIPSLCHLLHGASAECLAATSAAARAEAPSQTRERSSSCAFVSTSPCFSKKSGMDL